MRLALSRRASPSGLFPENRTPRSFQSDSEPLPAGFGGFVNGLPLVVIELKKPGVPARAALERLNPALPPEAITAAVDELTRDRSAMSLEAANREVYLLLKEGR